MTKAAELAKMGEVLTNSQIGGRRNIVSMVLCKWHREELSYWIGATDGYST